MDTKYEGSRFLQKLWQRVISICGVTSNKTLLLKHGVQSVEYNAGHYLYYNGISSSKEGIPLTAGISLVSLQGSVSKGYGCCVALCIALSPR